MTINEFGEPTVPCVICGDLTSMTGTNRCNRCWELERRIERDPGLANRIIERIKTERQIDAYLNFFSPLLPKDL